MFLLIFFAVIQGLLKVLAGVDTNFTVTSKASDEGGEESVTAFLYSGKKLKISV